MYERFHVRFTWEGLENMIDGPLAIARCCGHQLIPIVFWWSPLLRRCAGALNFTLVSNKRQVLIPTCRIQCIPSN